MVKWYKYVAAVAVSLCFSACGDKGTMSGRHYHQQPSEPPEIDVIEEGRGVDENDAIRNVIMKARLKAGKNFSVFRSVISNHDILQDTMVTYTPICLKGFRMIENGHDNGIVTIIARLTFVSESFGSVCK